MDNTLFLLLIFTTILSLLFDFMNGFHDAANSIATVVSTRVLQPIAAVVWAAFFNFIAFLIFGPKVAETVADIVKIEVSSVSYVILVFAAVLGALLWNIFTWILSLPTSSSHALIGGLAGAGLALGGWQVLQIDTILIVVAFIFISPLLGFILGYLSIALFYFLFRNVRAGVTNPIFRRGQLLSSALYSIGHGANDAQKTMGIIMALFIAGGIFNENTQLSLANPETRWIILSCQAAISLGTLFGGWRIVKTMGMKITKLRPLGGFCAEGSSAVSLFLATFLGIPVSSTHTITGAIIGVGSASTSFHRVKWGIARKIIWAWIITIPASGVVSALLYVLLKKIV